MDWSAWGQSTVYVDNGQTVGGIAQDFLMSSPGNASSYAARITGMLGPACGPPYTTCPFAGMGFSFLDAGGPHDLSAFTGIRFSMIVPAMDAVLRFTMSTLGTTPVSQGGTCTANCSNDYGNSFLPSSAGVWFQNALPFSGMTQEAGWGYVPVEGFALTDVLGVRWQYTAGQYSYDLSVDDVQLY